MHISLRVFLIALTSVVSITGGIIAFVPLFSSAMQSADTMANGFADTLSINIKTAVEPIFDGAQVAIETILFAAQTGDLHPNVRRTAFNWLGYAARTSGFQCSVFLDTGLYFVVTKTTNLFGNGIRTAPDNSLFAIAGDAVNGVFYWNLMNDVTLRMLTTKSSESSSTYNPLTRPFFTTIRSNRSWFKPFLDTSGSFGVMMSGAPVTFTYNTTANTVDTAKGAIGIRVDSETIVKYLSGLTVAKSGRALLVDGTTLTFLGGNFPESSVGSNRSLKTITDVQDTMVSEFVHHGGVETIKQCSGAQFCESNFVGANSQGYIVRVVPVTDEYGLNLRLVVIFAASDFLSAIQTSGLMAAGSSAASIVALTVAAVLLLHIVLRPLSKMGARLNVLSQFNDLAQFSRHDEALGGSLLSEISVVEKAYSNLCKELIKVKSFLPQGVLKQYELKAEPNRCVAASRYSDLTTDTTADLSTDDVMRDAQELSDDSFDEEQGSLHIVSTRQYHGVRAFASGPSNIPATRKVTIVFLNVVGSQQCVRLLGLSRFTATIQQLYQDVLETVTSARAVVEFVSGDRFMISFNASAPCVSQGPRAAWLISSLVRNPLFAARDCLHSVGGGADETLPTRGEVMLGLAIGASTGEALCGNFGCTEMARFCVFGDVVAHAANLMQRAKDWKLSNVVSNALGETMKVHYFLVHCGLLELSGGDERNTLSLVSSVVSKFRDLGHLNGNHPLQTLGMSPKIEAMLSLVNSAMERLAHGNDAKTASSILDALTCDTDNPMAENFVQRARATVEQLRVR